MAEVINIIPINPTTFEYQEYSVEDTSLINSNIIDTKFDPSTDYLEYFIYNLNNELLYANNLSFNNYRLIDNQLVLTPEKDLILNSFIEGQYNTLYNILSNKLGSSYLNTLYIQEISSDRTELRLNTTSIPNDGLVQKTNEFALQQNSEIGYLDFYINFGENKLVIANNILLDNSNPSDPTVLIKLYEPLPLEFNIKTECWVSEKISNSVAYNISISQTFNIDDLNIKIKGPNLNLQVQDKINNTTNYASYTNLKSTTSSQNSGSFYYQLNSILANKGITVNIDYSDYSQFVNLSSAQTRLENFYYKLSLIEGYQTSASLSSGTPTNYYVSSSNILYQNKINDIITNFDNYEYHLYFESSSTSWPKTNSTPPYINAGINSVLGQSFLVTQSLSASIYDNNNNNNLINAIPSYILEDPNNNQYKLFIEMLGQMFDSVWIYIKDVTNKSNADNRLDHGISKDLVAEVLTDLGFKLYQNNFSSDNLYSSYLGFTNSGSLYNIPFASNTLPAATGWEYINLFVTASATGSLIPTDDINKEVYKRIYHNLPYLLKTKGTVESLRTLLTIFGIPDTILRINEFGGKDKNPNTWDYWQNEYNYAFETTGSSKISIPFTTSSVNFGTVYPKAIEFRFKTFGLPTSNIPYSQSLLTDSNNSFGVVLEYTGSGYSSGSYNGSIIDPNYQYATLKFISGSASSSVYLPFYDGGWWSVLINADSGSTTAYTLYAKNKIYNGVDGNTIGFQASSSFVGDKFWSTSGQLFFGTSSVLNTQTYSAFSGSYQEIRYYNVPLSESAFDAYVMNPSSIEGNIISGSQSSYNSLFFRLPLGGELYTGSTSVHPGITGSFVTQSFAGASSTGSFSGSYSFVANTETIFYDQPAVGIQNIVSNKLKIVNTSLPYSGSIDSNIPYNKILSPFISIQQNYTISSSYTNNIDYVEVAFSPQNEINEDIMSTLGYFNIGDYIGDPRQISSNDESYPDLDILRTNYFQKYFSNYDWNDYLRLIKFFDNSLFKTLQDFIPVKTSLASGAIVKQNLLERNKYPVPQMEFTQSEYTSSISMYEISGSNGGSMNITSIVTQSWTGTNPSLSGSVPFTQNSEDEFYNGQFSGSFIEVTNGELGDNDNLPLYNNVLENRLSSFYMDVDYTNNITTPVNQQLILSGSADKFPIPDSNYTTARNINPRYDGSRTTSPGFNQPIYKNTNSLITQSQVPNASRYSNWFVYFDYIENAYPEVPRGSNVHAIYAINTEGQAIPLTGDNIYVEDISNIFPPGLKSTILPAVYSAGTKNPQVTVFDGGAIYQTIITLSGSNGNPYSPFGRLYGNFSPGISYETYFYTGSSNNILNDALNTPSANEYWLNYVLPSGGLETSGINPDNAYLYAYDNLYIYNKSIDLYTSTNLTTGETQPIKYSDTLLPITKYDLIRFGDSRKSGSDSSFLDFSFNGLQLLTIVSSSVDLTPASSSVYLSNNISSSLLGVGNIINNSTTTFQNWRIFRRVPNETNITLTTFPNFTDPGFLIPENFNPDYNPYELAKKAGIIS